MRSRRVDACFPGARSVGANQRAGHMQKVTASLHLARFAPALRQAVGAEEMDPLLRERDRHHLYRRELRVRQEGRRNQSRVWVILS